MMASHHQLMLATVLLAATSADWLVNPPTTAVTVTETEIGGRAAVTMANGLISRTWLIEPNWVTWSIHEGQDDLLRSVQPESTFQLDNKTVLLVGAVTGITNHAFKNSSDELRSAPGSYQYASLRVVPIATRYEWTPGTRFSDDAPWPPLGIALEVTFEPPALIPPEACPGNCSLQECPGGALCCSNPGGRFFRSPHSGDLYPYYGKPCKQQSDCGQCTVDGLCTCTALPGQQPPLTGCCTPNVATSAEEATPGLPIIMITYEMYQGLPAMSKKVAVKAAKGSCHVIRGLMVEQLSFQETHLGRNSHFDTDWAWFQGDRVSLFTSFARQPQYPCQTGRNGWVAGCSGGAGVFGIVRDKSYTNSYQYAWPSLLVAGFSIDYSCAERLPCIEQTAAEFCMKYGPCPEGAKYRWEQVLCDVPLSNASTPSDFESFTVIELFHGPDAGREERGLATRRMHAKLAPQVTENPIYMHCTKSDSSSLRNCVDQAAAVGFEMVIISFGAGFNLESTDADYLAQMKNISEYAGSKGVEMGGYDLLADTRGRGHDPNTECISASTGKPSGSTCLASQGSDSILANILNFVDQTNWQSVETDGPYEGESCAATNHTHHRNLADSIYTNWARNMQFYHELVAKGTYINAPDPYFLDGTHKDGMGYDEEQWGKPRWEWIAQARQQIYDQTFHKIASMGWQFCPIEPYNGGPESILEPICEHLSEYEYILATYLGTGTQAAYRGTRLFDPECPASQAMVAKWVSWFKTYRKILNADIIHLRRPDLSSLDAMLHVNSNTTKTVDRGMLMVWNQTPEPKREMLKVPLYLTGLETEAAVSVEGGAVVKYKLARDYSIDLNMSLPPMSLTWVLIKQG